MNLYEFEGRKIFEKHGIIIPVGEVVRRGDNIADAYRKLGLEDVVVKAQVLSGKRGKNNGIKFCNNLEEVEKAVTEIFAMSIRGQYVASVLLTEKINIESENYLSITYDTNKKQPVLIFSTEGGMDIEDVSDEKILRVPLDIRDSVLPLVGGVRGGYTKASLSELSNPSQPPLIGEEYLEVAQRLWQCFLAEDTRVVEINPLVKTTSGEIIALDAKVALDDDAFFRHNKEAQERAKEKGLEPATVTDWDLFESRTMLGRPATEREIAVQEIDKGEKYYQGTAGKYIELDGDIAVLFSGGGASIANMDALYQVGLKPANYTEYSGNPPQEKVFELSKIVLSKPGLKGLWIVGGVANFTDVAATFAGIVEAIDEIKPNFPIVVRRAGPNDKEGIRMIEECAKRNNLQIKIFGKEISMSDTAQVLADLIK
ncbi:MAG: ATP citrate lyase citrate-binding domain-containing protein [Patescibacteria group bacterium]|nr:ATP citrate lyase citrate-binding domain-containing protein [Patescibacteria group bacterium]